MSQSNGFRRILAHLLGLHTPGPAQSGRPQGASSIPDTPGESRTRPRLEDPAGQGDEEQWGAAASSDKNMRRNLPGGGRGARRQEGEENLTAPFTMERAYDMLTVGMNYTVERHENEGRVTLVGTWDGFPFMIEEPEDHDGMLMVTGDGEDTIAEDQIDEVSALINDWNRDKFFPTVSLYHTPLGPVVRTTYLVDLSSGVTDAQLELHLDSALSSCTQALLHLKPMLPQM